MKHFHKHISLLAVSVFTLGIVAVIPAGTVFAQDTATTTENSGPGRVRTEERVRDATKKVADDARQRADERSVIQAAATDTTATSEGEGENRDKAKKLLSEQRQGKKVKSLEDRQKSCEARKASLIKKSESYTAKANRHLEVFDKIYDKVEAFQAEKQLTVEGYDDLKLTVDAKRTAAVESIEVLSAVSTDIDCTAEDPAEAVAAIKTAVKDTRESLHDYRVAIKDLAVELRTAADKKPSDTAAEAEL